MMAAGYVAEAGWGVLYIRAEYPESVQKSLNPFRNYGNWVCWEIIF